VIGEAPTAPVIDPGPLSVARGVIATEIARRDGVVSEEELAAIEEQLETQS
jgi:hypothetical protein